MSTRPRKVEDQAPFWNYPIKFCFSVELRCGRILPPWGPNRAKTIQASSIRASAQTRQGSAQAADRLACEAWNDRRSGRDAIWGCRCRFEPVAARHQHPQHLVAALNQRPSGALRRESPVPERKEALSFLGRFATGDWIHRRPTEDLPLQAGIDQTIERERQSPSPRRHQT